MKIGCIVMAAGNARRFGSNKLDARVEERPCCAGRWRPFRRRALTG